MGIAIQMVSSSLLEMNFSAFIDGFSKKTGVTNNLFLKMV